MTPELKAKWVATLRSGNYEQGRARMRDELDCCCCLGVLCDIVRPDGWSKRPSYGGTGWFNGVGDLYPDFRILEAAGLTEDACRKLAKMNDDGQSFSKIADYIEVRL